jgi:hypothetical protein
MSNLEVLITKWSKDWYFKVSLKEKYKKEYLERFKLSVK